MKRLLLVLSLVILNGCYTQLAMFHTPKPETEEREWDYDSYSSYSLGTYYSDQLFHSYYGYGSPFGYRNIYSNMYGWNYYTSPYYRSYNPYYYINEKSIKQQYVIFFNNKTCYLISFFIAIPYLNLVYFIITLNHNKCIGK